MRLAAAIVLLALPAAAQERVARHRVVLLVENTRPLAEAEVAGAVERLYSATRVEKEKFDPAAKATYVLERGKDCWRVHVETRFFVIRSGNEPVFDEEFALRQRAEVGRAISAHKGHLEFCGGDFSLPERRKVKSIAEYEQEKARWAALMRERDVLIDDAICRFAAEFADRKPTAIYVADSNWLFVADETTLDWLKLPRAVSRLASGVGDPVRWHDGDGKEREAATRKAQANWGKFAGSFGRNGGEGYRVLIDLQELDRFEPVWVEVREIKADRIKGTILREPITLEAPKGGEVKTDRKAVRDWVFVEGGVTVGGYTLAPKDPAGR